MTRRPVAAGRLLPVAAALGVLFVGCGEEAEVDDGVLHAVMLGSDEVFDARESAAVDAVGLRLRALGPSLGAVLDADGGPVAQPALARLQADVASLADAVAAAPPPVRAGFAGYVDGWQAVADAEERRIAALAVGDDPAAADASADRAAAVGRLQALDQARIDRVIDAFGEDEAARLLDIESSTST